MMRVLLCAILVAPTLLTASAGRAAMPPPPPAFVPLSPRQGVYPVPPVPATFPYLPPGGGALPVASAHSLDVPVVCTTTLFNERINGGELPVVAYCTITNEKNCWDNDYMVIVTATPQDCCNACLAVPGCSGFDWSQDITDSASYRHCYLKQDLPPQNDDTRYVSGVLHRGGGSAESLIAASADIAAAG